MEKRDIAERFWLPVTMTLVIMLYGTLGYAAIILEATPLDGLYWTILTLGGVGFRDTQLAGPGAELLSISLIVGLLVAVVVTAAIARRCRSTSSSAASVGSAARWSTSTAAPAWASS